MRVLILLPGHILGGAERAAAQVADAVAASGHDLVVGTSRPDDLAFGLEGHRSRRMAVDPTTKWMAPVGIAQVRRAPVDVVYSYHRWTTWIADHARRLGGAPVVHHAQTMLPLRHGERWGDRTVAVSAALRDHVIAGGATAADTIVVHNGAIPRDPPLRRPVATTRLVFVGRLVDGKGVDHLLTALVGLPDTTLTVIGEGPARQDLEGLAGRLGLTDRVTFTGWVPDPWPLFGDATIGVIPSDTYPEGLPLVACEMMMSGLPIIATDIPGLREVDHDEAVRLVPPASAPALRQAISEMSADDVTRLGDLARAHALANFDATEKARRVVDVLVETADIGSTRR